MNSDKPDINDLRIDRSHSGKRRSRIWIPLLILALIIPIAAVAWHFSQPGAVQVRTAAAREVSAAAQSTVLNASGYVNARRKATVSSKVTGKVVAVLIEEGMEVSKDQVLARLDDINVRASLRLAEAQVNVARTSLVETEVRLEEARLDLTRTERLAKEEVASEADLDAAKAEVDSLAARLERQRGEVSVAERQLALWRRQLEDTVIRAPFDGVIVSKDAQPGEMISPVSAGGGFTRTGICTVVDMNSLEIEVDVNESYINRVRTGQPVEAVLDAYPDWKIPCRVIAIIPTADRQKATVEVRIGIDQLDPRILPDMGIKVAFQDDEEKGGAPVGNSRAVAVPDDAVRTESGKDVIYVVSNGSVERRAVALGGTLGDDVLVVSGLAGGERVVVEGPAALADGELVEEMDR